MDRVKRKSKIQTNGSQPEAHVNEDLMTSSNVTCNISSNQLEISNIWEVVDNSIQKRDLKEWWRQIQNNLMKKIILLQNLKISIGIMRILI